MSAFHAEQAGGDGRIGTAAIQITGQIGSRMDNGEAAAGTRSEVVEMSGHVQGAGGKTGPCGGRTQLNEHEKGYAVRGGVVALVIDAARSFCDSGEDLKRDVALDEAWNVHLAAGTAGKKIAIPQKRVSVEIGDEEPAMQSHGGWRSRVGPGHEDVVHAVFGEGWAEGEKGDDDQKKKSESELQQASRK